MNSRPASRNSPGCQSSSVGTWTQRSGRRRPRPSKRSAEGAPARARENGDVERERRRPFPGAPCRRRRGRSGPNAAPASTEGPDSSRRRRSCPRPSPSGRRPRPSRALSEVAGGAEHHLLRHDVFAKRRVHLVERDLRAQGIELGEIQRRLVALDEAVERGGERRVLGARAQEVDAMIASLARFSSAAVKPSRAHAPSRRRMPLWHAPTFCGAAIAKGLQSALALNWPPRR